MKITVTAGSCHISTTDQYPVGFLNWFKLLKRWGVSGINPVVDQNCHEYYFQACFLLKFYFHSKFFACHFLGTKKAYPSSNFITSAPPLLGNVKFSSSFLSSIFIFNLHLNTTNWRAKRGHFVQPVESIMNKVELQVFTLSPSTGGALC